MSTFEIVMPVAGIVKALQDTKHHDHAGLVRMNY